MATPRRQTRLSPRGFDRLDARFYDATEARTPSACGLAEEALDRMRQSIRALPESAHDEHYRRTAIVSSASRRFNARCVGDQYGGD